jgi:hypothetical protein
MRAIRSWRSSDPPPAKPPEQPQSWQLELEHLARRVAQLSLRWGHAPDLFAQERSSIASALRRLARANGVTDGEST